MIFECFIRRVNAIGKWENIVGFMGQGVVNIVTIRTTFVNNFVDWNLKEIGIEASGPVSGPIE